MARHCSSVTVVDVGAVGTVVSAFSGDSADDIGGAGDADTACSTGGAGGAGDAVVDFIDVDTVAAVSDNFVASAVSGATSAAIFVIVALDSCLSSLFEPSAIAMRTTGLALGWEDSRGLQKLKYVGKLSLSRLFYNAGGRGTRGTAARQIREPKIQASTE